MSELAERADHTEALLNSLIGAKSDNKFARLISYLLNSQSDEGCWGPEEYLYFRPIMTVQAIETLLRMGLNINTEWEIFGSGTNPIRIGSIKKAFDWLISAQNSDGGWGEDFWDTCQVIKALLYGGYPSQTPAIEKGVEYLRHIINEQWKPELDKQWFGPAFYAAGAEVFALIGETNVVTSLIRQIWDSQDVSEGKFCGPKLPSGGYRIDCVWHTSQVLIAFHEIGASSASSSKINQAVNWLKTTQSESGSWGQGFDWAEHIFTGNALAALSLHDGEECLNKGISWFMDRQSSLGDITHIWRLGATCMAAWALSYVFREMLVINIPYNFVLDMLYLIRQQQETMRVISDERARANEGRNRITTEKHELEVEVHKLQAENTKLKEDNQSREEQIHEYESQIAVMKKQIASYWIKMTDRQIGVIGLILGVIGIILAIITILPLTK